MKPFCVVVIAVLSMVGMGRGQASNTASHTVRIVINDIVSLAASGEKVDLAIGQPPEDEVHGVQVSEHSATLRYTTTPIPGKMRRITATLSDGRIPDGMQLALRAVPFDGAAHRQERIFLDHTAKEIINRIGSSSAESSAHLEYTLEIENAARPIPGSEEALTVTFTLCDDL